ncbi:PDZ domain-containing protein, partial [Candidatus Saccharibacteria bacterium]|nr:PDZ domain-containing protein [Candidatus Saccharibacteria bacterium]
NSGNSGGPLVNAIGEVIGINTATSSSAENMGFAIPISSVKGMLNQLIESGKAKRTYLGVYSTSITAESAKQNNLPVTSGEYLYSPSSYSAIIKGSPADKAGLKDKDIITAVNGVKVGAAGSLASLIGEYKPGDTVQLTVIREGKETAINVTLEGYSDSK